MVGPGLGTCVGTGVGNGVGRGRGRIVGSGSGTVVGLLVGRNEGSSVGGGRPSQVSVMVKSPLSESDAPSTLNQYDPCSVRVAESTLHGSKPLVSLAKILLLLVDGHPFHNFKRVAIAVSGEQVVALIANPSKAANTKLAAPVDEELP